MADTNKKYLISILLFIGLLLLVVFTYRMYQKNRHYNIKIQSLESKLNYKDSIIYKFSSLFYADSLYISENYEEAARAYGDIESKYPDLKPFLANKRLDLLSKMNEKSSNFKKGDFVNLDRKSNNITNVNQSSLSTKSLADQRDSDDFDKLQSWRDSIEKLKHEVEKLKTNTNEFLKFRSSKNDDVNYVGQVKDGKANGTGVGLWSTGGKYEGQWVNNKRQGKGTYTWADGDVYEGEFFMDKRNGNGRYKWKKGEYYIGGWKDDKRNGEGILYDKNNKIKFNGIWNNDEYKK